MRNILLFLLYQLETFWDLKKIWNNFLHRVFSNTYLLSWKLRSSWRHLKYFFEFLRLSQSDILICLLICCSVFIIQDFCGINIFSNDQTGRSSEIIFSTVASIGGIIIGMYYAGVLSVGTSIYSKLPREAKELLAREPIGSVFIRFLAFLTFISVAFLVAGFLGYEESVFATQFVLGLSGIAVFSMVKLGARLFYLTDPTELSYSSLTLLDDLFSATQVGAFQWNNSNFQNFYKQQAQTALRTIKILSDYAKKEKHLASESFIQLIQQTTSTLIKYQEIKRKIPSGSLWYAIKYKHKQWYQQPETTLDISEMMGYIQPEQIKDKLWIETELCSTFKDCFIANLNSHKFDIVDECLKYADNSSRRIARNGELKFSLQLHDDLWQCWLEYIKKTQPNLLKKSDQQRLLNIGDSIGVMKTNIILGCLEYIADYDESKIDDALYRVSWFKRKSIYHLGIPYQLHERLEFLFDKIHFEIKLEKIKITPDWFIKKLVSQAAAAEVKLVIDNLFASILTSRILLLDLPMLISGKQDSFSIFANCIDIDRRIEHHNKATILLNKAEALWINFLEKQKLEDTLWPQLNLKEIKEKFETMGISLIEKSAQIGGNASLLKNDGELPDFSGKFLHRAGNKIIDFLTHDKPVFNGNLFHLYFYNSLMMFDQLRKGDSADPTWIVDSRMQIAVAPIIDLIDVSGYALLISDYCENKDIENSVQKVWDDYLNTEKKARLEQLAAILTYSEGFFASLPYRSILRQKWFQQIHDYLQQNVKVEQDWYQPRGALGYQERRKVSHSSPLIQAFLSRTMGLSFEGDNIFIDRYLSKIPESEGLSFSHKQGNIDDILSREEKRNEKNEK
jgi:hypothetical protein